MSKAPALVLSLVFPVFVVCAPLPAQIGTPKVTVRVILVDKELNQKPVPHLTVALAADSGAPINPYEEKPDVAGNAERQAPPGKYRMTAPQGVYYQGHHFAWDVEINVSG